MHQHPGTPIPRADDRDSIVGVRRGVYAGPDALSAGCERRRGWQVLSGYELFFYQGVDAFEVFTGARGRRRVAKRCAGRASQLCRTRQSSGALYVAPRRDGRADLVSVQDQGKLPAAAGFEHARAAARGCPEPALDSGSAR